MENELASLTAHHASEQDDMSNELNEKMAAILEELKKKAKISYQHELDSMNTRFNEDCEAAKSMMGSLFGNILPISLDPQLNCLGFSWEFRVMGSWSLLPGFITWVGGL